MTQHTFQLQITRMQDNWGQHHYREPRVAILWRAFREADDVVFTAAVDHLIGYQRQAPMVAEIEKAMAVAQLEVSQQRSRGAGGIYGIIQDAARLTPADPDYVKACLAHIHDGTVTRKLTRAQYDEGCDALDRMAEQVSRQKKAPR